jgi:O-antigen/teichoic acid export membrane protein
MSRVKRLGESVKWGIVSTAGTTLLQLALIAVMARLLAPADYGLVATAGVALRFLSYFAQMGISQAIIQKSNLDVGDVGAALRVSLLVSFGFTFVAAVAAPAAQWFFQMPGLGWIVAALSLNFALAGAGNVATGLMRRAQDFRSIAFIEIGSYVLGYGAVGLSAAWGGAHAWALVAATLTQSALATGMGCALALRGVDLRHTSHQRRHFISFGGRFAILGFLEFIGSSVDAIVIGRLLGPAAAGLYNRAQLLANLPADRPAGILNRALFPFLSALHSEREKQAIGVQLSLMLVGSYALAVSAGVAVAAPDIALALLGRQWGGAAPILRILALAVGPLFITQVVGTTFDSLGALRRKMVVQVGMLLALAIGVYAFFPAGLEGIALAVVLAETLRAAVYLAMLQREFKFPGRDWWVCLACGVCVPSCVAIGTWLASRVGGASMPTAVRLVLDVAGAGVGLLAAILVLRPLLGKAESIRELGRRVLLVERLVSGGLRKRPAPEVPGIDSRER